MNAMKQALKRVRIPTDEELNRANEGDVSDPDLLCVNWRHGCNRVTHGAQGGYLTLCDDCEDAFIMSCAP